MNGNCWKFFWRSGVEILFNEETVSANAKEDVRRGSIWARRKVDRFMIMILETRLCYIDPCCEIYITRIGIWCNCSIFESIHEASL